jgi:DNA polymerase-3 subunit delta'
MQGFGSIVGQTPVLALLEKALETDHLAHALLFEGPVGIGKATVTRALAQALNCERGRRGCGECLPCQKIVGGHHPDYILFDMTPKGLTERVRELLSILGYPPHEGRARMIVFDPADALAEGRQEAANVLLKSLEEAPLRTYFVLISAESRRLPVTISSRCQRVRFRPLSESQIVEFLMTQRGTPREQALLIAHDATGSLARALELESPESLEEQRGRWQLMERTMTVDANDPRALFAAVEEVADREKLELLLPLFSASLHDALLLREGLAPGSNRSKLATALSKSRSTAELLAAYRATEQAARALRSNIAPALVLEHLLLEMHTRPALKFARANERERSA